MLVQLFSQRVACCLEDALLDAWTKLASIGSQVGAAVEVQKAPLTVKTVWSCWSCRVHGESYRDNLGVCGNEEGFRMTCMMRIFASSRAMIFSVSVFALARELLGNCVHHPLSVPKPEIVPIWNINDLANETGINRRRSAVSPSVRHRCCTFQSNLS
jgi:hypothetical protein